MINGICWITLAKMNFIELVMHLRNRVIPRITLIPWGRPSCDPSALNLNGDKVSKEARKSESSLTSVGNFVPLKAEAEEWLQKLKHATHSETLLAWSLWGHHVHTAMRTSKKLSQPNAPNNQPQSSVLKSVMLFFIGWAQFVCAPIYWLILNFNAPVFCLSIAL